MYAPRKIATIPNKPLTGGLSCRNTNAMSSVKMGTNAFRGAIYESSSRFSASRFMKVAIIMDNDAPNSTYGDCLKASMPS